MSLPSTEAKTGYNGLWDKNTKILSAYNVTENTQVTYIMLSNTLNANVSLWRLHAATTQPIIMECYIHIARDPENYPFIP